MLRPYSLTTLLLAFLAIQGCSKTVEVSYGEIKPELRLKIEDIIDLELEQLKEKYLGKKVSILKSRYGACVYKMGIANACEAGFTLTDSDITNPNTLSKNNKINISISAYFNYTLDYHQRYARNFPSKTRTTPTAAMLKNSIYINENVSQEACRNELNFTARLPSHPNKPWLGCEFSLPEFEFSGLVYHISKSTSERYGTSMRLHIIPTGLNYSYQASRLFD